MLEHVCVFAATLAGFLHVASSEGRVNVCHLLMLFGLREAALLITGSSLCVTVRPRVICELRICERVTVRITAVRKLPLSACGRLGGNLRIV